jgi:hypothetical protein
MPPGPHWKGDLEKIPGLAGADGKLMFSLIRLSSPCLTVQCSIEMEVRSKRLPCESEECPKICSREISQTVLDGNDPCIYCSKLVRDKLLLSQFLHQKSPGFEVPFPSIPSFALLL